MLKDIRRKMEEHNENFNKDLENIKKNQIELKNTKTELKKIHQKESTVDQMIQRNRSANWKREQWKSPKLNIKRKKNFLKEDNLRDLWDNINHINICIIGVPEGGEEREKRAENLFEEIIAENFSNLGEEIGIQVQEAKRVRNKMIPKISTARHMVIKMAKIR